ncbi:DUF3192 domain-containing protein [Thalassotalea euphylliae]
MKVNSTQEECTPLLFTNGQLTAIGNVAYKQFSDMVQIVN